MEDLNHAFLAARFPTLALLLHNPTCIQKRIKPHKQEEKLDLMIEIGEESIPGDISYKGIIGVRVRGKSKVLMRKGIF